MGVILATGGELISGLGEKSELPDVERASFMQNIHLYWLMLEISISRKQGNLNKEK